MELEIFLKMAPKRGQPGGYYKIPNCLVHYILPETNEEEYIPVEACGVTDDTYIIEKKKNKVEIRFPGKSGTHFVSPKLLKHPNE